MNTFGQAYVVGKQSLVQVPLYDSRSVLDNRSRFRRDMIDELKRANSIYIPTGRWPTRGWLLLARSDYNTINSYSTTLRLDVGDPKSPNNVAPLLNLSVVQAQCVTRGLASDSNALFLVEVTDGRGIAFNEWFQTPITSNYNIRAPAYPSTDRGGTFHPNSMNGGTTWTWATMLQDMWNGVNSLNGSNILGNWPGLPSGVTISGTPEGFWFPGVPAWYAFNDVLEHIGLAVACDLTKANPFTIVQPGATDSAFTNLQTKYLGNLEDDLEWIDTGAGRVPSTVTVLFRRRNQAYGTEETVTYGDDGLAKQWDMSSLYSVSFSAPSKFSSAVGAHYIWSDFTVRYDQDNNILAADTTLANTIAQERVTQYFAKIYRQTAGYMTQTYAGALPFVTGAQVDGVCYYQDYRNDDNWGGWRTQIVRGGYPPWRGLWDHRA